jgi:hypothetical protein
MAKGSPKVAKVIANKKNGRVTLLAPTPLSAGRPRRALSARLVDDYGLTRFVPQAEADACRQLAQHRSTHKACRPHRARLL